MKATPSVSHGSTKPTSSALTLRLASQWPYQFAHGVGAHDPARPRKLLLNRGEIERLAARVGQERLVLVPLSLYFKDGRAKVELALAQGRTKGDKRQAIAKKDAQREIDRELGRQRKGKD